MWAFKTTLNALYISGFSQNAPQLPLFSKRLICDVFQKNARSLNFDDAPDIGPSSITAKTNDTTINPSWRRIGKGLWW